MSVRIITKSPRQTEILGKRLSRFLKSGDIVTLDGDLGAGKTTFVKGIAEGLGVKNCKYVNSPSFVLIKEYKGKTSLYHFDLYRLNNLYDIEYIGPSEYLGQDGVVVIEWGQRLKGLMPAEYLKISIRILNTKERCFEFKGFGKRYDSIVRRHFK